MVGYVKCYAVRSLFAIRDHAPVASFQWRIAVNPPQESEFRGVLEALETCFETPRVSGELERWIADVQRNVDSVGTLLPKLKVNMPRAVGKSPSMNRN